MSQENVLYYGWEKRLRISYPLIFFLVEVYIAGEKKGFIKSYPFSLSSHPDGL